MRKDDRRRKEDVTDRPAGVVDDVDQRHLEELVVRVYPFALLLVRRDELNNRRLHLEAAACAVHENSFAVVQLSCLHVSLVEQLLVGAEHERSLHRRKLRLRVARRPGQVTTLRELLVVIELVGVLEHLRLARFAEAEITLVDFLDVLHFGGARIIELHAAICLLHLVFVVLQTIDDGKQISQSFAAAGLPQHDHALASEDARLDHLLLNWRNILVLVQLQRSEKSRMHRLSLIREGLLEAFGAFENSKLLVVVS